ncbi:MAG: hypothetical protein JXA90_07320, partial [Planctomycetes bacterium]|nr:hypothetical protein [Planctomycetota bacterium]
MMPANVADTLDTELRTKELCKQFLAIGEKELTGTLEVVSVDGQVKSFLCRQGTIADVDTGAEQTLLTAILMDSGRVSPRHLKKAQRTAEKSGVRLADAILEMNLIPEDELLAAIEEGISREVTDVFGWAIEQSAFQSHEIDERVEGFQSELSDYFDLQADPETLFLEAAQRLERWDLVQSCYELLLDVFYATPGTFSYFREPDSFPAETRILGAIDGVKDVEETVRESGLDPFAAIDVIRGLIREQAIELINPVQMFQLGAQVASEGNMEKACRLLQRAKDRGLNDFDIELRLAQALEAVGRKSEAAAAYLEFCEKCLDQRRLGDAIRSLRRLVKLSPDDTEPTKKLIGLLVQNNRVEEGIETAVALASRLKLKGEHRAALDLLIPLRASSPRNVALHEKIIEIAKLVQDERLVQEERELIAQAFHDRRDTAEALEAYQGMFCEGNDSLEVRLKLVDLHREQGNRQKAIDHLSAVLNLGGRQKVKDIKTLLFVHETMLELDPGNVRSNRWLIQHYLKSGKSERAVERIKAWLPELEKAGNHADLSSALQQLISLEDRLEYRWSLASVLETLGKRQESQSVLRDLVAQALRTRSFDAAARALDHILKTEPLDIETRKSQVELLDLRGDKKAAAEKLKDLATLEILAGRIQEAEGFCRQLLILHPEDAEIVDKLGNLCMELGDKQKGIEQYLKAAKIHISNKNLGRARWTLDRLLKAQPQHTEGKSLLARLQQLEEALSAPPQEAAPALPKPKPKPKPGPSSAITLQKQPFESATPVKTTVNGITARLRSLKSDKESGGRGKQMGKVGNIAARLKSLAGGGEGPPAATSPSPSPQRAPPGSGLPGQSARGEMTETGRGGADSAASPLRLAAVDASAFEALLAGEGGEMSSPTATEEASSTAQTPATPASGAEG